jgi:hypothetical protein
MEGSLLRLLIFSQSVTKHGRHRQFIFLIGNIFLKSSPLKLLAQMNRNMLRSISFRHDPLANMAATGKSRF